MKFMTLTSNGKYIDIPMLILGTAGFDDISKKEDYFSLLDRYVELGGNCIDTARCYCSWVNGGADVSETVIGEWINSRNNRSDIKIITKGGYPDGKNKITRLDRESLEFDIKASLEFLNTDYVDVYLLHRDDERIPVSQIMPILNNFVKSGKVKFIGASNWRGERIAEANEYSRKYGLAEFSASQILYSLADSSGSDYNDNTLVSMNSAEYAFYAKSKIPVMAYSPLAKGFFSKMINNENVDSFKSSMKFATKINLSRLSRVKKYSDNTGLTPTQIALAYLNCNPVKTAAVFGCSNISQLEDCMTAANLSISLKDISYLENGS